MYSCWDHMYCIASHFILPDVVLFLLIQTQFKEGFFCLCVSGNGWIAVRLEEEEEEEKAKQTVESFHCTLLSKWLSLLPWCAGCSSSCTSSTKFSVRVLLLLFFCCFFISSWLFNRVILPRVLVIWSIYLFFSSLRHYCYLLPGICLCAL